MCKHIQQLAFYLHIAVCVAHGGAALYQRTTEITLFLLPKRP